MPPRIATVSVVATALTDVIAAIAIMAVTISSQGVALGRATTAWQASPEATIASLLTHFESQRYHKAIKAAAKLSSSDTLPTASETTHQVLLIEALSHLRLRQFHKAKLKLAAVSPYLGAPLGPYFVSLQLQALIGSAIIGLRSCDEGRYPWDTLPESSIFRFSGAELLISCYLKTGDLKEAGRFLATLREMHLTEQNPMAIALPLWEGQIAEHSGNIESAINSYKGVLEKQPFSPLGRQAQRLLTKLYARIGTQKKQTPAALLSYADALRATQKGRAAKQIYRRIKRLTKRYPQKRSLYHTAEIGLIELSMVRYKYRRALKRLSKLLGSYLDNNNRVRVHYLMGDIYARLGQQQKALAAFRYNIDHHPAHPLTTEGALSSARISYGQQQWQEGDYFAEWILNSTNKRYATILIDDDGVHRAPAALGTATENAHWMLAWSYYWQERPSTEVRAQFKAISDTLNADSPHQTDHTGSGTLVAGALYWQARLASKEEDTDGANQLLQKLEIIAPVSFYTLSLRDELAPYDARHPLTIGILDDGPIPIPSAQGSDMLGPLYLFQRGLTKTAVAFIRRINMLQLSEPDRAIAAWIYRKNSDIPRSAVVSRRLFAKTRDLSIYRMAFPRPFPNEIATTAKRFEINPLLLYSFMRIESGFNPHAQSPRQARGLMQMIPKTARRIARSIGLRRFRQKKLFQPRHAITLGGAYIAQLLKRFNGDLVSVIGSYHAGEKAVSRWRKARGNLTRDEFIDNVPYTSTRRYIRKVLRTYGVYRKLYMPAGKNSPIFNFSMHNPINPTANTTARRSP